MNRALPLLLAAALGGCAPRPAPGSDPLAALGAHRAEWIAAGEEAEQALALGRYAEAAALFERRIALVPAPAGDLDGACRLDLYNLACARAMAGRTAAALDALEAAMAAGTGVVGFDLLATDPDLASLHGEPRWTALLRGLSWNEEVTLVDGGSPEAGAVVVVLGVNPGGNAIPGALAAIPAPPYGAAWTTRLDPGARAAEKAVFALRSAEGRRPAAPARRILLATGAAGVRLAWEVLLREPGTFSRAVLDGPAPPRWALLDRGAERMGTEVLAAGPRGVPDPGIGVRVRDCGSREAALKEALR
jgi:hypothetical protein